MSVEPYVLPEIKARAVMGNERVDVRDFPKVDPIKVPEHYTYSGVEVIDAIEGWGLGYRLGNVVKYVARAERKGNAVEDLKKARQYLTREINAREGRKGWE